MKKIMKILWLKLYKKKWVMSVEEAEAYKTEYEINSAATWDEWKQVWSYEHIDDKMKLSGEAQGLRVSREVMEMLYKWYPDRDDVHSTTPKYTGREMNRTIRAAIAQSYRKLQKMDHQKAQQQWVANIQTWLETHPYQQTTYTPTTREHGE